MKFIKLMLENTMKSFPTIASDHQNIVSTNFLDPEYAARGFLYLSWNTEAGCFLIPDN